MCERARALQPHRYIYQRALATEVRRHARAVAAFIFYSYEKSDKSEFAYLCWHAADCAERADSTGCSLAAGLGGSAHYIMEQPTHTQRQRAALGLFVRTERRSQKIHSTDTMDFGTRYSPSAGKVTRNLHLK